MLETGGVRPQARLRRHHQIVSSQLVRHIDGGNCEKSGDKYKYKLRAKENIRNVLIRAFPQTPT